MLKRHRIVLVILGLGLTLVATKMALRGSGQDGPNKTKEERATPVQEGVMTQKEREHARIYSQQYQWRKGQRLARLQGTKEAEVIIAYPTIPTDPSAAPLTTNTFIQGLYCEADAVVVGTITSKESQLTDDGTFSFTDYQMTVTQVFKNNAFASIVPASSIEVTRPGGTILLNGRVIRVKDLSFPPLDSNENYLLFLKFVPSTGSYRAFRRGSDFGLRDDSFFPLTRESIPDDLQRTGRTEILINTINTTVATGCNK